MIKMIVFLWGKVYEGRSHAHGDEDKVMTRKQKAENKAHETEHSPKKAKQETQTDHSTNVEPSKDVGSEFQEFCKDIGDKLSVNQMKEILEANGQDSSGSDIAVGYKWLVI